LIRLFDHLTKDYRDWGLLRDLGPRPRTRCQSRPRARIDLPARVRWQPLSCLSLAVPERQQWVVMADDQHLRWRLVTRLLVLPQVSVRKISKPHHAFPGGVFIAGRAAAAAAAGPDSHPIIRECRSSMIHSDPPIKIVITMRVNRSVIRFQRCADDRSRCRK